MSGGGSADGSRVVRGCTRLRTELCLIQNAGGSCSCVKDLCNGGAVSRNVGFPRLFLPAVTIVALREGVT